MPKKDNTKPRGKMSSYAFFVQTCREEHKRKHPTDGVVFAEFSRKCAEKWRTMSANEKKRFEEMAKKDKERFNNDMANYVPPEGAKPVRAKKRKDPNAPKRALSAFFFFCNEERPKVRERLPAGSSVGDVAKKLGKMWEVCPNKPKFEALAAADKKRYEKEMAAYKAGGTVAKKAKPSPEKVAPPPDDDEEEEDEDEEDEEEEDDDDDDDDE